jgi:hypothetical protein
MSQRLILSHCRAFATPRGVSRHDVYAPCSHTRHAIPSRPVSTISLSTRNSADLAMTHHMRRCADGRDPVDYPEITYDLTGLRSPCRPHGGSPHAGGCLACPGSSAPHRLCYWYGVPWVCHQTAQGKVLSYRSIWGGCFTGVDAMGDTLPKTRAISHTINTLNHLRHGGG